MVPRTLGRLWPVSGLEDLLGSWQIHKAPSICQEPQLSLFLARGKHGRRKVENVGLSHLVTADATGS